MALKKGDKAPEFKLFDSDKNERSLSEFLGKKKKTIIAFYPGAFSGACTNEMCALRDSMSEFTRMNAQVVGISVDSPFANGGFKAANKLDFPLLSDFDRKVSTQYTGLYQNFGHIPGYTASRRSVYILDENGTVTFAWATDSPGQEPDYAAIRSALA